MVIAEANVAATTDQTIVIPGHGRPVSNRSELKEYRDMLVAIRENVAALHRLHAKHLSEDGDLTGATTAEERAKRVEQRSGERSADSAS